MLNYQGFQGLSGTDSIITKTEGRDQFCGENWLLPGQSDNTAHPPVPRITAQRQARILIEDI